MKVSVRLKKQYLEQVLEKVKHIAKKNIEVFDDDIVLVLDIKNVTFELLEDLLPYTKPQEVDKKVVEALKTIYEISIDFQIETDYANVAEMLRQLNDVNDFIVEIIAKRIDLLSILGVYYNENNPNNGRPLFKIKVGREGSEVIYFTELMTPKITDKDISEIKRLYKLPRVDEFDAEIDKFMNYKHFSIRNWWD